MGQKRRTYEDWNVCMSSNLSSPRWLMVKTLVMGIPTALYAQVSYIENSTQLTYINTIKYTEHNKHIKTINAQKLFGCWNCISTDFQSFFIAWNTWMQLYLFSILNKNILQHLNCNDKQNMDGMYVFTAYLYKHKQNASSQLSASQ